LLDISKLASANLISIPARHLTNNTTIFAPATTLAKFSNNEIEHFSNNESMQKCVLF